MDRNAKPVKRKAKKKFCALLLQMWCIFLIYLKIWLHFNQNLMWLKVLSKQVLYGVRLDKNVFFTAIHMNVLYFDDMNHLCGFWDSCVTKIFKISLSELTKGSFYYESLQFWILYLALLRSFHSCSVRTIWTSPLGKSSGTLRNFMIDVELYGTFRILRLNGFTVYCSVLDNLRRCIALLAASSTFSL